VVQAGYADLFSRLDLRDAINQALERLPVPFRETVVLIDLEDMAYGEASKVLGVPVGTVRSRLFRGRRLLQQALITYAQDAGLIGTGANPSTGVPDHDADA
jgi:RNA polymerase sigma-70 factor (ECF subfamily)